MAGTARGSAIIPMGFRARNDCDRNISPDGFDRRLKFVCEKKFLLLLLKIQISLGDPKVESTVRYLGIEVDDALAIAEQVGI